MAIHTKNDNRNHNYISVHTNDNLLFIIRSFLCDCSCCMTAHLLIKHVLLFFLTGNRKPKETVSGCPLFPTVPITWTLCLAPPPLTAIEWDVTKKGPFRSGEIFLSLLNKNKIFHIELSSTVHKVSEIHQFLTAYVKTCKDTTLIVLF